MKVATSDPHLPFHECNAITKPGFTMKHSARALRLDCEDFFWPSFIFGLKMLQKSQSSRGFVQCESGPEVMWFVRVTI